MNAQDITQPNENTEAPAPTPIAGYSKPSEETIALVNEFKLLEAQIGALWRKAKASGMADPRMLAHGKTIIQDGMMWLNRSLFKPKDVFDEE